MASAPEELASIEEAIYDQSFRTLGEQARVLEGLRARAGTLIGAATVTTAFVGGLTVSRGSENPRLDALSWVAIGLYAAVVVLSLLISATSRKWIFVHHPRRLLSEYVEPGPPKSLSHFRRSIAYYNGRNYDANGRQLTRLSALFLAAMVVFVAELVLWLSRLAA
jgi:hypothetical protein